MNCLVSLQVTGTGERLCALGAGVQRLTTVNCMVGLQDTGTGERLATRGTGKELFFSVGEVVVL